MPSTLYTRTIIFGLQMGLTQQPGDWHLIILAVPLMGLKDGLDLSREWCMQQQMVELPFLF
jgi:hypothetical protein